MSFSKGEAKGRGALQAACCDSETTSTAAESFSSAEGQPLTLRLIILATGFLETGSGPLEGETIPIFGIQAHTWAYRALVNITTEYE